MKNLLMNNKKAQTMAIILIIIGVLVVTTLGLIYYNTRAPTQRTVDTELETLRVTGDCETEPYLSAIFTDIINPGTAVSNAGVEARVNGKFVGMVTLGSSGTTLSIDDTLDIIANGTNYLDKEIKGIKITKCGENEIDDGLYKLDGAPSIVIFNTAGEQLGDDYLGQSATAINQSSSANPITVDMHFTMPSDEGAEAVVFVVESANTSEVDKISMSCNLGTLTEYSQNQPDLHSTEGLDSTSIFNSFLLKGFKNDGGKTICSITLDPETGITIGVGNNSAFVTAYFPQSFVDIDGTIQYDIQNSDGTAKHESTASTDYDFKIGDV